MILIKGNDYVKFMTVQVVSYMDLPKDERIQRKLDQKAQRHHPPIGNKWFGALPFAIKSFFKRAE
ncbi:YqzE family protein [Paucisalibacillus globulus]|uniref:YqzE family protein n=1 Tax=Paucisalibacillus globulus TaxID=351095 RepID=UPI002480DEAC|nr:YqzE family protein [Paucisalibacillus globulus]